MLISFLSEYYRTFKDCDIADIQNCLYGMIIDNLETVHVLYSHAEGILQVPILHTLGLLVKNGYLVEMLQDEPNLLRDILLKSDGYLLKEISSVCPSSEYDTVSELLLRVFKRNKLFLVKHLLLFEIEQTETETTILRRNSLVSRITLIYFSQIGSKYLERLLRPFYAQLNSNYEIDPHKTSDDISANTENLQNILKH